MHVYTYAHTFMLLQFNELHSFHAMVQRVALSTAANMCKKLPSDAADFVMEAVPLLTNLLQYHDSKVKSLLLVTPHPFKLAKKHWILISFHSPLCFLYRF